MKEGTDRPPSLGGPTLIAAMTVAGLVFLVACLLVLFSGPKEHDHVIVLVGVAATMIPSLTAAGFAARNSRDLRGGMVTEHARRGARAAIREEQVVTRDGPVITAELIALRRLIEAQRQDRPLEDVHPYPDDGAERDGTP